MKIRLNNTKKGLTTVWSLEKFQSALEQMRELYQVWNELRSVKLFHAFLTNLFFLSTLFFFSKQQRDNDSVSGESGDEVDPFNDPDDKWEKDFKLDSSSSRFVRHKWIINWQVNPSSSCTWVIYCQLSISFVRPRDCVFLHRRISSLSSSGLSSSRARSSSAGKPQGTSWNTH